jgi:hypothetical protein
MKNTGIRHKIVRPAIWAIGIMLLSASPMDGAFDVSWYTVDGGGGASTDGVYMVMGTAGQPDAGKSSGSGYGLFGGFWTGVYEFRYQVRPIAGGGGTSTGGAYRLTGTIGQPSVGSSAGGSYVLRGGFSQ